MATQFVCRARRLVLRALPPAPRLYNAYTARAYEASVEALQRPGLDLLSTLEPVCTPDGVCSAPTTRDDQLVALEMLADLGYVARGSREYTALQEVA